MLLPVLRHRATPIELEQAVLLGLVRSQRREAVAVAEALESPTDAVARALWLVLRARGDGPLTDAQLDDLATLVAGGGDLDPSIRMQAAWLYLTRTGQADDALSLLLP
jgi:hypothetical protein